MTKILKYSDIEKERDKTPLYCSFCGREKTEVKKLVAGPNVFICDGCIELCYGMVHEGLADEELVTGFLKGNLQKLTAVKLLTILHELDDKDLVEIRVLDRKK